MKKILFLLLLVNTTFAQVDLREKISQMIMIGFSGTTLSDTMIVNDIRQRKVGGIILFTANLSTPQQIQSLNDSLQLISQTPLFIAVDQEGGYVARLKVSNGFAKTKSAYEIGTIINNEDSTRAWAKQMAGWLQQSKFNVDFAPVVDVDVNPVSPAIGYYGRSFSNKPDTVFFHSDLFIEELHNQGLISALKHFPGHGSATSDSHDGFTDITNTWADSELVPYRRLIENGYNDFIMSGHLFNSNLDPSYPASLSNKILTGLLRDSLNYNGLIITDGMFMGAITNNYTFDEAVELAINAGNDMLLYTTNKLEGKSLVDSVVNIVLNKISQGKITEERINESYDRIMIKKQLITDVKTITSTSIPDEFNLLNYPNPFNSTTQISFTIPKSGILSLKVYNILGEEIEEIVNQYFDAGIHKISFNADRLSSGVYLIRMNFGNNYISHKIVLIK